MSVVDVLAAVEVELRAAQRKHAPMHSPHEGFARIAEELDELWDHVRADTGATAEARAEAIQVAAMACRYAFDLCSGPRADCERCELEAASPEQFRCADHSPRPSGAAR